MRILIFVIGVPLTLLIYLALRFLKRPVTPLRSAEIAGTAMGIVQLIPVVIFLLAMPLTILLLPLGTLAWLFHPSWLPSLFEGAPTWLGVPSFVWIGGALLTYWVVMLFRWLAERVRLMRLAKRL